MTRFGELLSKWQDLKRLLRVDIIFGKILNMLWQYFYASAKIQTVENGSILNKYSSHLVTLYCKTSDAFSDRRNRMGLNASISLVRMFLFAS